MSHFASPDTRDAAAIINAAVGAAQPTPIKPGGLYVAVVPQGHQATVIDDRESDDRRADAPRRRRGTATLTRAESFTAYVSAHTFADAEVGPALYAFDDSHQITAVFNGPGPNTPGWGDDRAVLRLVTTPDWEAWTSRDGTALSQVQLAEFVEDHLRNVKSPDGATLLEMVTTFEAMTNVEIQSVTRLQNGTRQLTWKETTSARAGQTREAEFPDFFLLELVPFEGLDPVAVGARLRYKVTRDHGLQLTFLLDDTETILRDAFDAVLAAVEQDTGMVSYHGSPPRLIVLRRLAAAAWRDWEGDPRRPSPYNRIALHRGDNWLVLLIALVLLGWPLVVLALLAQGALWIALGQAVMAVLVVVVVEGFGGVRR